MNPELNSADARLSWRRTTTCWVRSPADLPLLTETWLLDQDEPTGCSCRFDRHRQAVPAGLPGGLTEYDFDQERTAPPRRAIQVARLRLRLPSLELDMTCLKI
jgi:hypothetical protein